MVLKQKQRLALVVVTLIAALILFLLYHFKLIGARASAPRPNLTMPKVKEWKLLD